MSSGITDEIRLALHAIWVRRWLALAVAWGICLAGWLAVSLVPNRYESQARVLVQVQTLLSGKIGIDKAEMQRAVDSVRQTLTSTANLETVVKSTALARTVSSESDMAARIAALQKAITIEETADGLFVVTARTGFSGLSDAQNAELASAIVSKLIELFESQNAAGGRGETQTTLDFFDRQIAEKRIDLDNAEAQRAAFEQRNGGLVGAGGSVSAQLASLRQEQSNIESDLAAARSSLAAASGQLAATPATTSTPIPGATGPARARLSALEGQLADMRARGWTDGHPDVAAVLSQLPGARAAARGEGTGGSTMTQPNPIYESIRSSQAERQATVAALQARKAQLDGQMAALMGRMTGEPAAQAAYAKLTRDTETLKSGYDKLLQDREEVRLRGQVETSTRPVQFVVTDPPSRPTAPAAPNRPLLLTIVLLVGVLGGGAAAWVKAQLAATYPTVARLERASGVSAIGAVGEVLTDAVRRERKHRLTVFAASLGGLGVMFALLMVIEVAVRGGVA